MGLLAGAAARAHDVERRQHRGREERGPVSESASTFAPCPPPRHCISREFLPCKSTDDDGADHHVTWPAEYEAPVERGQRDVPCEPEQAGEGVEGEDGPFVEEAAVGFGAAGEDGVEEEVGECEEGEGRGGDEVGGGGGGGGGVGVVEVPGCYCGGGG